MENLENIKGVEFSIDVQLLERFIYVRKNTELLCLPLTSEDYNISATIDTSPPKWHLAHTSWFFERFLLEKFNKEHKTYRTEFYFLFNSYYRRSADYLKKEKRNILSRPGIDEIYKYRETVTDQVINLLHELNDYKRDEFLKILEIGINHEEQHQELLIMDIKRNFFENPIRPAYQQNVQYSSEINQRYWKNFPEGLVKVGVPAQSSQFAFDNEKDQHSVWLESFSLSSHLITNDEYLEFIDEGGYENPQLWLSDGWDLKEKENWNAPLYWEKHGKDWWHYTLSGMQQVELTAPVVHVSFYEANAFARWRQARLPREAEWEVAAKFESVDGHFAEAQSYEPAPSEDIHQYFSQIHGSVWEWTQSAYLPYPRFHPTQHGLEEHNGKFMCNQFVLKGGSCLTPKNHYRTTYRNYYYPHMRWQYSGVRLAKDC